ncbi:hypothetical protein [Sorangium sp. So ce542]|uniref:hypothetical protein n=1 Tax=Sorangium sp. So ce542 TaxID=3133316 RepID=UPI003F5ECD83
MSLTPALAVTLGNERFDSHILDASVCLAPLPAASWFRVSLPPGVDPSAVAGDPAVLTLDGGEGSETVLTGKVRHVKRGVRATEVLAADGGADLAYRPTATFERQAARDVVRALCGDANVDVGRLDIDLDLAAYAAHPQRTAAEHVAELARIAGAMGVFDEGGALVVAPPPTGPADLALQYGREIVSFDRRDAAPRAAPYLVGSGPAGSVDAPDALRHTTAVIPGDTPSPTPGARWIPTPILRTPRAGNDATRARQSEHAAQATTARMGCFLLPRLRPGMVIQVKGLPDRFPGGDWFVLRVTHRVARGASSTSIEARAAAGGGGLGGLAAAAGAAIGGLL